MALIECRGLCLGYENNIIANDISFTVNKGDYLCIVGENGSGKSTLVKTLLGLTPKLGGTLEFGDGMLKNEIGYLPQQTAVQRDFPASVWEIVLSGCQGKCGIRPFYSKADKALAENALKKMALTDIKNKCYRELSGGQQQRVLLARALCATTSLILLDEPIAGLDPVIAAQMYDIIEQLNKDDKIAVIMVTHEMSALKYATHVLHIGKGEYFYGTSVEYKKSSLSRGFGGAEDE